MNQKKIGAHDFIWNKDNISQFWNNIYSLETSGNGFAETAGKGLLKFINSKVKLNGKVLDYGVGFGYLLKYLSEYRKVTELYGVEFSEESANMVNDVLKNEIKFKACIAIKHPAVTWDDEFFDFVFIAEVIEHLEPDELNRLLIEIRRVLKRNGKLVITVPNNENLESRKVLCPACGALFHPVQHLVSFNKNVLDALTTSFGFKTIYCDSNLLKTYNKHLFKMLIKRFLFYFNKRELPNLIYIGKKQ